MSNAYPSTALYLANESRRTEFQTRAAHERIVTQARARQAGLPGHTVRAAARHGELLAEADGYRLTAHMAHPSIVSGAITLLRQGVGHGLIQVGTWLQGELRPADIPAPAATA